MNLREPAISYAERGWPVFPLVPGDKNPATPNGFYQATTDLRRIEEWWSIADFNIGIATGHAFDVFDVDDISAEDYGLKPTVWTPGGGYHVYVAPGRPCRARFALGSDWRGTGGYVVAPPSVCLKRGGFWEWAVDEVSIAMVPPALEAALKRAQRAPVASRPPPRGLASRLERAEWRILNAPIGERNTTLSRQAWSCTELVANGEITLEEWEERLTNAALEAGLEEDEIRRTLDSALRGSPYL